MMAAFPELRTYLHNALGVNSITIMDSTNFVLVKNLSDEFHDLLSFRLGKLVGYKAYIYVKPEAAFRFHKPRPVAFAILSKI